MAVTTMVADHDVPLVQPRHDGSGIGFLTDVGMGCAEENPSWEPVQHPLLKQADAEHRLI